MPSDTTLTAHAVGSCSTGELAFLYGPLAPPPPLRAGKANSFTGDVHEISVPLTAMITLGDTFIDELTWTGMTAGGHAVELRNARGQVIRRLVASQANDSNFTGVKVGRVADGGYQVPVLDSGTLLVTLGRRPRNA